MKGIYHGNDQSLSYYYGPGHTILCELGKEENFNVLSFLIKCAEVKVKKHFLEKQLSNNLFTYHYENQATLRHTVTCTAEVPIWVNGEEMFADAYSGT